MIAVVRHIVAKAIPRAVLTMVPGLAISDGAPYKDLTAELPVSSSKHYSIRPLSAVDGVVWHHSATPTTASIRNMAEFHIEVRKWPAIAYHWAIDMDGVIYKLHDMDVTSYQAQGHNSHTAGALLIGNFDKIEPSEKMEMSAYRLQAYLKETYNLKTSWYHGETKATACPGKFAIPLIKSMQYGPRPKRK